MFSLRRYILPMAALGLALAPLAPADDKMAHPLPEGAKLRLGAPRIVQSGRIGAVAFSPDGSLVAIGGDAPFAGGDSATRLWEVATAKQLKQLPAHEKGVSALAFSPDGKLVATAGNDGLINVCEVASGKSLQQLKGHEVPKMGGFGIPGVIPALAFAPDGQQLASAGQDKTVRLWDLTNGKELHKLPGHAAAVLAVAFSPDGKVVASAAQDGGVRLWDPAGGKVLHALEKHRASVPSIAFAPDSQLLATGGADGAICLWDPAAGKLVRELRDPADGAGDVIDACSLVAFAKDGKSLYSGWIANSLFRVWDPATGKEMRNFTVQRSGGNFIGAFNPATLTLALAPRFAFNDGMLRFYDAATGQERAPEGHRREVLAAVFAPDGKLIATGGSDRTIRLWDAATGKEVRSMKGLYSRPARLSFSADGSRLASAAGDFSDPIITVWDTAAGKEVALLRGHTFGVRDIALAPDGKTLASVGTDQTVRTWEVATGKERGQFKLPQFTSSSVFTPDGKVLIVAPGQAKGPIVLYDVATGKESRQVPLPDRDPARATTISMAVSPDGRLVAIALSGQAIALWDLVAGKEVRKIGEVLEPNPRGFGFTLPMLFSPDGLLLVTTTTEKSTPIIHVWELASGKECRQFKGGHQRDVLARAFASDSRRLVTGSGDGTALVWDLVGLEGPATELSAKQLEELNADLAGADAGKAFKALAMMVASHKQSVPYLKERLKPVAAPDAKLVQQLIADLDSKDFDVRKKAGDDLEKIADLAEPALREVLKGQPSLEVKQRVEQILKRLDGHVLTPEQLRIVRELNVLEKVGTTEARQVLEGMAKGAAGAQITKEAQRSLERLAQRPLPRE